nr:unnamed protein product [Callosobruchus analis]
MLWQLVNSKCDPGVSNKAIPEISYKDTTYTNNIDIANDDISGSEDLADMRGAVGFLLISLKMMYNNQGFQKVFTALADTKRFGKPTTFDTAVKHCRLVSTESHYNILYKEQSGRNTKTKEVVPPYNKLIL